MGDLHIKVVDVPGQVSGQEAWTAELRSGFPGSGAAVVAGGVQVYTRAQLERDDSPLNAGGPPLKLDLATVLKALREDEQINPIFARTGIRLFEFLKATGVADAWKAQRTAGARTFLELPESVAEWPWELLAESVRKDLEIRFFDNPDLPVMRVHGRPAPGLQWSCSTVRILLVSGQEILDPGKQLKASDELREIREAFHKARLSVLIELCEYPPNKIDLHAAIRAFSPHIIHFIGHGEQPPGARYRLNFQRDSSWKWTAQEIFSFFNVETWKPRLVVLNACHASRFDVHAASVAEALLEAGIPAVIGAVAAFRVDYARQFAKAFYRALAQKENIEKAVTTARGALALLAPYEGAERRHWALPILTVSAPPEHILRFKDAASTANVGKPIEDVYRRPGTFVDRVSDRWSILSAFQPVGSAPGVRGVILNGGEQVGKSWLVRRSIRDFLDAGYIVRYAEGAAKSSRRSIDILKDWRGNPRENSVLLGPLPPPHFDAFDVAYSKADANPVPTAVQDVFRTFLEGLQSFRNGRKVLLILDKFRESGSARVSQSDFREGLMNQLLQKLQQVDPVDPNLDGIFALLVVGRLFDAGQGAVLDVDEFGLNLLDRFKTCEVSGFLKSQVNNLFDEFSDFSSDEAAEHLRQYFRIKAASDVWSPRMFNLIAGAFGDAQP